MKETHLGLRKLFYLGGILSLAAGIQLFLLSEQTETYFAWTIQSPLTAATFGAFYFGTMFFGFLSSRESNWAHVRGPALGLFAFLAITLLATLLHLDKFHLASENGFTVTAAWLWMAIYFLMPPLLVIMLVVQRQRPGNELERSSNIPMWIRAVLFVHGILGIIFALLLFLTPQLGISIWPWALTPLTSRALSAWLISFGIVDLQTIWEKDWRNVKIMTIGYIIFGVLGITALVRYAGEVTWLSIGSVGYVIYLLSMIIVGIIGQIRISQLNKG